jgi:serine/threonine-protein kinase RsbW
LLLAENSCGHVSKAAQLVGAAEVRYTQIGRCVPAFFWFVMHTRVFPANFESLATVREFVGTAAREMGMDDSEVYAVQLAVDEACSNIIEHAYGGQNRGEIECTCEASDEALTVTLRDHGQPFDPAKVALPDLSLGLDERPVGGLGLLLMRHLMDEVHFEARGEAGNVLTMIKRRRGSA